MDPIIGGPACASKHNALAAVTGSGQAPDGSYAIACTDATLRILSAHGTHIGAVHSIPNALPLHAGRARLGA